MANVNSAASDYGQTIHPHALTGVVDAPGDGPFAMNHAPLLATFLDPNIGFNFFEDFINVHTAPGVPGDIIFVQDAGKTGQDEILDAKGGVLRIFVDGNDNDECYGSYNFEHFQLDTDCWFEARVRFNENGGTAGKSAFVIGISDTVGADSILNGSTLMTSFDGVALAKLEDDTVFTMVVSNVAVQKTVTAASTASTFADATWVRLGFYWDADGGTAASSGRCYFFVDGDPAATTDLVTTTMDEAHIFFGLKMHASTTEASLDIDYIKACNVR